ncbi:hypothetical protein A2U01_0108295, partial [Trifolium medium]|nr:hypothetical protein [Trifolium medium]
MPHDASCFVFTDAPSYESVTSFSVQVRIIPPISFCIIEELLPLLPCVLP